MKTAPLPLAVIDLSQTDSHERERRPIVQDVRTASSSSGVFYVTNHGVPDALIAAHFAFARSFFGLDLGEKRAIDVSRSNCFRGYEAFGTQTIDESAPGDLKEGFIMGPDLAPDHPHVVSGFPNTGSNLWPQRPAEFRPHMESYVAAMNALGRRLARVLARSLDLPEHYFEAALADPLTYTQLLHYPSLPHARTNRLGAGAHHDWGMLTILLQDDVGGLEYRGADAQWHSAPPLPGTFVVILGEMMVRFTDGLYRSAMHRVRKNVSGRSRYSMPTFFDPAYDYRVECVPTCASPSARPRYATCTVAEHMQEMSRQTLSATR